MKANIVSRFLSKKIFTNFVGVLSVLSILVIINHFFIISRESTVLGLFTTELTQIIFLRYLRDLHIIFALSLILGYTITLLRINSTSEKIILHSNGISEISIINLTRNLFIIFISFFTLLVMYFSPLANEKIFHLQKIAESRPGYIFLQEGQFQKFNKTVFFSPEISIEDDYQVMKNVFLLIRNTPDERKLIIANTGIKSIDQFSGNVYLELKDGYFFDNSKSRKVSSYTKFKKYSFLLYENKNNLTGNNEFDIESTPIFELFKNNDQKAIGEILYRFSLPILLIILLLISSFIVKTSSRVTKNKSIMFVLILFIIYFNSVVLIKDMTNDWMNGFSMFVTIHLTFFILLIFYFFKNRRLS